MQCVIYYSTRSFPNDNQRHCAIDIYCWRKLFLLLFKNRKRLCDLKSDSKTFKISGKTKRFPNSQSHLCSLIAVIYSHDVWRKIYETYFYLFHIGTCVLWYWNNLWNDKYEIILKSSYENYIRVHERKRNFIWKCNINFA